MKKPVEQNVSIVNKVTTDVDRSKHVLKSKCGGLFLQYNFVGMQINVIGILLLLFRDNSTEYMKTAHLRNRKYRLFIDFRQKKKKSDCGRTFCEKFAVTRSQVDSRQRYYELRIRIKCYRTICDAT